MKKTALLLIALFFVLFVTGQKLPFQGKLMDSGTAVTGSHTFIFTIDTTWTETHTGVQVTDGLYFVVLGSTNPLPSNLFYSNDERQMAISVDGTELGPVTLYRPLTGNQDGLNLKGSTTGTLQGGFYTGTPEAENLPYLRFVGNNSNFMNLFMTVTRDTASVESGYFRLRSTQNNMAVATPEEIWFRDNTNNYVAQIKSFKGNTNEYSGQLWLRGPNSLNVEVGSKHWENADLPWLNMRGTTGQSVATFSGEKFDQNSPERERGQMTIFDTDDKKAWINSTEINLLKSDWSAVAGLNNEGDAGNLFMRGPNSGNIWMGGQSWIPGKGADRPLFTMTGSADQPILELECSNDDTNEEAIIRLHSQIGNQANLYPTLFEMRDANRTYSTFRKSDWGNGSFGMIELAGPNSSNFEFSSFGGNPDRGYMALRGSAGDNRVEIFANENNGNEYGQIVTRNADGVQSVVTHEEFLLTKPDWTMLASLYNGGDFGQLTLRGPNTQNFYIGSENWGNHDVPYMNMNGKDDQPKMYITTSDDVNGERGIINLTNNNGEETTYANNGTWGTVPFNMWSGAMVNGVLTINGDIQGSGTNNYNSDRRLKKDIQPLGSNMLGKVTQLGGYSYYWRKDEFPKKNFSDTQQIGLIAQELEEQFPALVKTGEDGFKSVNYNGFTAVLLEAVKELNAKVDKLETENNRLQTQLSASSEKSDEMDDLRKQVDLLTKLVQEKMSDSEKTADKN